MGILLMCISRSMGRYAMAAILSLWIVYMIPYYDNCIAYDDQRTRQSSVIVNFNVMLNCL